MIQALTTGGRSFKGAARYYLHDKRRDGEAERDTADRVAWTHTVNLPTQDPHRAWRMMATTAMKADELKAGAGVKATGNKLRKPVFAYSLSWDPSERPSQAEQLEAAQETIKLLGFGEHQALIVCHNDEPHPHVHVIVNRVHPTEGRAHEPSYPKKLLSKWAQAYEEKRGKIFCPQRVINNEKRGKGEFVRHPRVSRPAYEFAKAAAPETARAAFVRTEQKQEDAQLSQAGRDMHDSHAKQWAELKRAYAAAKDRLYARSDERKKEKADEVKQEFKPAWRELFKQQRDEQRTFGERERSPIGKLWNMAQTAKEVRRMDEPMPAGLLGFVFGIFSRSERENVQAIKQQGERRDLAGRVSKAVQRERQEIQKQTKVEADALRANFLRQCAELRDRQGKDRAAMQAAWKGRNEQRRAAYAALPSRAANWNRLEELGRQAGQERGQAVAKRRSIERRP